jgi:hypothetical protein
MLIRFANQLPQSRNLLPIRRTPLIRLPKLLPHSFHRLGKPWALLICFRKLSSQLFNRLRSRSMLISMFALQPSYCCLMQPNLLLIFQIFALKLLNEQSLLSQQLFDASRIQPSLFSPFLNFAPKPSNRMVIASLLLFRSSQGKFMVHSKLLPFAWLTWAPTGVSPSPPPDSHRVWRQPQWLVQGS